jgi:hypothetical protein
LPMATYWDISFTKCCFLGVGIRLKVSGIRIAPGTEPDV